MPVHDDVPDRSTAPVLGFLENLVEGKVVNQITVDPITRKWATVALERMLSIRWAGAAAGQQSAIAQQLD